MRLFLESKYITFRILRIWFHQLQKENIISVKFKLFGKNIVK